jgi:hypothetical protein
MARGATRIAEDGVSIQQAAKEAAVTVKDLEQYLIDAGLKGPAPTGAR